MREGKAIPESTTRSSSGHSLGSKPPPHSRELHQGASAQMNVQSAGCRRDFSCMVASLFLPCRKQWFQQQTGSCGQSRQRIRAAVSVRAGAPGATAGGSTSPQL